jgi:TonB-dependent receptor
MVARNFPNPNILQIWDSLTTQNQQQREGDQLDNPANYNAQEIISAGYAMVKTNFGKLYVLAGIRYESTYVHDTHNIVNKGYGPTASDQQNYADILPSIHFNFELSDNQNFRLSLYKALNRPDYSEIVPYVDVTANGNTNGNPNLKHTTGTCADARYEFYPSGEEAFTAGIFYKYLLNPIEEITDINNNTWYSNASNCTNYGLELVAIKYLGDFGINMNYTFTNSSIKVPEQINYKNQQLSTEVLVSRPLVGQSPNLFNAALIYRKKNIGLKCQLTYTMQGKNLVVPSSFLNQDSYQITYNDLGFSIEKNLGKHVELYAKCINMINTNLNYQMKNGIHTGTVTSYRSYLLGLKVKL